MTDLLWACSILSSAVASGVALSHVLEIPGKHRLAPAVVAEIQQRLYPGFRRFGMVIEPIALVSTVVLAIVLAGDGASFALVAGAAGALVAMGLVFPLLTAPMNRRIADWEESRPHANWRSTLRRWELSHGLRGALMFTAAVLSTAGALVA